MGFWEGFEKRALMSTKSKELLTGGLFDILPFGTSGHTAIADRPIEHSRTDEWNNRTLGLLGGGALGLGAGVGLASQLVKHPKIPFEVSVLLAKGGLPAGAIIGSLIGHASSIGKYYDENGKLKPEYK